MAVGGNIGPDGVLDGTVSLRTYQLPGAARSQFWGFPYAAGMLSTEKSHDQLYGYWETGIRINNLDKGMHFALWLLPQDDKWPPEIDLLEIVNNDVNSSDTPLSKWYNNAHGNPIPGYGLQTYSKPDWQGWHKIGFEWTATTMKWFYDGVLVREQANYIDKPMYFLATWEVGSNWPGAPNATTVSPSEVELDYVRAYTATPGTTSPSAPTRYTLSWSDEFNTPSIGTSADKNFAPYFVDWNVRHLAGNNDQAIKVADGELSANGSQTYGEALAATDVYGGAPYFHHYNIPPASPPPPVSLPLPAQFAGRDVQVWEGRRDYDDITYDTFRSTPAWNAGPVATLAPDEWHAGYATKLAFDNFVQADINLSAAGNVDLDIMLVGEKRGSATLGNGNDKLTWVAHSNSPTSPGYSNTMAIQTGGGDDVVTIVPVGLTSLADHDKAGNGSTFNPTYDGLYSVADVTFGAGNDRVTVEGKVSLILHVGTGQATAVGGASNDTLYAGSGTARFSGGAGQDTFVFEPGNGHVVIEDFLVGTDRLKFIGLSQAVQTQSTSEDGTAGVLLTYDSGGSSVFLKGITQMSNEDMIPV